MYVRLRLLLLKIYNYYLIINNVLLYIMLNLNVMYNINMIEFELFEQRASLVVKSKTMLLIYFAIGGGI